MRISDWSSDVCSSDLLQINGGRNDGFVAWGDSGALVMGHYGDNAANLRLWQIARDFTLCDNFFMGAFAGSLFVAVLNGLVILSIGMALGVPLAPLVGVWSRSDGRRVGKECVSRC